MSHALLIAANGAAIFGVELDQLAPGRPVIVDDAALGYPTRLSQLPPGEFSVQPVISVYEPVKRPDGKTIWGHLNDGRQEVFRSRGSCTSSPATWTAST